jgi:DNA-binding transcriptional LysR family regulator
MRYANDIILTLGPVGTDASAVAETLTERILYTDSFEDAMLAAAAGEGLALIACGYKSISKLESWGDLHFAFIDQLRVVDVLHIPTKPMCIAINELASDREHVATHPTTEVFSRSTNLKPLFFANKVAAVEAAAAGTCGACVGSCDVVATYPQLQETKRIHASMVWVVYRKRTT